MSEENFLQDLAKSIKVPADITKAAIEPSANQIGEGLADLFYIAFSPIAKARIKKEVEIKKFREEIENEISKINPHDIKEPALNIIGPALEASKYYIEEETIRNMFAKIIASSMDNRLTTQVNHWFVEIVKQLSPLDVQNLKSFGNVANHPIVNYIHTSNFGKSSFHNDVFLENSECNNLDQISVSITNLKRLGIVTTSYSSYFNQESYEKFTQHEFYINWKKAFESSNNLEIPKEIQLIHPNFTNLSSKIEIEKGIIELTPLGSSLKRICLD